MPIRTRPARSLLALALIVNLVVAGAPGAAMGHQPDASSTRTASTSAPRPEPDALGTAVRTTHDRTADASNPLRSDRQRALDRPTPARASEPEAPTAIRVAWVTRAAPAAPQPKAKSVSTAEAVSGGSGSSGGSSSSKFKGRNHVWIPALGINRSVSFFSCSSSAYPGNRVYRWGCAGSNNVYLFGHAHSVFKPLHDAYVRGRLSKGMKVIYADGNGKLSTYAVSWWKVTTPDKGAWAYAGQSRPSLTLQTCVGARSQYRLIVRLSKVG
jgi:sortase (surface protein transpeptidase)